MAILAIDPGTTQSAYVILDGERPERFGIIDNHELLLMLDDLGWCRHLAIEMVASYGMPVGKEVFETVLWTGRFIERFYNGYTKIYRKDEKIALCGNMKAKDANIRQALIDKYGPGKEKAIGTKKNPGPLYGFKADMWAALAVAHTYYHKQQQGEL